MRLDRVPSVDALVDHADRRRGTLPSRGPRGGGTGSLFLSGSLAVPLAVQEERFGRHKARYDARCHHARERKGRR
jgi:hypothetical protein